MKNPKCGYAFALTLLCVVGSAAAQPTVAQTAVWTDGKVAADARSASIGFDVTNDRSILVVTAYVDNLMTSYSFSSVDFGGQAPDLTVADTTGRLTSFVFLDPSTASGLNFNFAKTNTSDGQPDGSGIGLIFYEVSGANLSPASITTVTASDTIDTLTANELVVSFAARNGQIAGPVENTALFDGMDESSFDDELTLVGDGAIASASATATTIGSQDITWTNAPDGRIAYAFRAAPGGLVSLFDFNYDPADGSSSVRIVGEPGTRYQLVEADDLDFSNPDQSPIPLDTATVGSLDGDVVITDGNGTAIVQFNLGTAKPATFIRAEATPLP